jgi:hypothetical protein
MPGIETLSMHAAAAPSQPLLPPPYDPAQSLAQPSHQSTNAFALLRCTSTTLLRRPRKRKRQQEADVPQELLKRQSRHNRKFDDSVQIPDKSKRRDVLITD